MSGLWRGRGGTESALAGHAAGEPFLLLDGTGTMLDPAVVGTVPGTRIAAIGMGDGEPVSSAIALAGIGLRPLSPVHGRTSLLTGGDLAIDWVRRARGAWRWDDGIDTPLGEQAEIYQVAFGPPSAPLATWTTTNPALVIPAARLAELTALAPSGPLLIRQLGDHGQSDALVLTLP